MTWTSRSPARATGITALQMDIKITGVTQEIMRNALEQAKRAREFILDKMAEAISETRTELAEHAPRISTVKIDPEQIGMVIGKGGETIRALEADYEVQIDIEEDGTILIYATDGTKAKAAIEAIESITKEPEVGDTYTGKVVKTTDFGAFVELKKGTDGLLHVSNVGPGPGRSHRGRDQPRRHRSTWSSRKWTRSAAGSGSSSSRSTRTARSSSPTS